MTQLMARMECAEGSQPCARHLCRTRSTTWMNAAHHSSPSTTATYSGDVDATAVRWYVEAVAVGTADTGCLHRLCWNAPLGSGASGGKCWDDAVMWSLLVSQLTGVRLPPKPCWNAPPQCLTPLCQSSFVRVNNRPSFVLSTIMSSTKWLTFQDGVQGADWRCGIANHVRRQ